MVRAPSTDEAIEVDSLELGTRVSAPTRVSELSQLGREVSVLAEQMKEMLAFQKSVQTHPRSQGRSKNLKWTKDGKPICFVSNKVGHFGHDCYHREKQKSGNQGNQSKSQASKN